MELLVEKIYFVCVEVLRPSQPSESCWARSVYLTTLFFLDRFSPLAVNQYCAHSFTRNWQLLFLNQRKRENDRKKFSWPISTKECCRPGGDRTLFYFTNFITETRLFKYIENFTSKNGKFSDKNSDISHISAQNIYCGYSLEPPRRGGSNEYPQSMFLSRNKKT